VQCAFVRYRENLAMILDPLVEEFATNVTAQTEAIFRGDAKSGNKHAERYIAAFEKLRAHGDEGREALAILLKHSSVDVRTMAAAYLLRYRTTEARAVLEEAARGRGLIAFECQYTLKGWEEGTWALDPE
jgi:hypothetical protein